MVKRRLTASKLGGGARLLLALATSTDVRRSWSLRLSRPGNLFQPHNDTEANRYPEVFVALRDWIGEGDDDIRLLSFGCSTGEEVFSLRRYFPSAYIKGVDISRANIADCKRRQRRLQDARLDFVRASSTQAEASRLYDAILCMAVFRHGDLGTQHPESCAHRITFEAFEVTVTDLARCLKPRGYLVVEHSNFRFSDTAVAAQFECVARRSCTTTDCQRTPLFGPNNRLLETPTCIEIAFRKQAEKGKTPAINATSK